MRPDSIRDKANEQIQAILRGSFTNSQIKHFYKQCLPAPQNKSDPIGTIASSDFPDNAIQILKNGNNNSNNPDSTSTVAAFLQFINQKILDFLYRDQSNDGFRMPDGDPYYASSIPDFKFKAKLSAEMSGAQAINAIENYATFFSKLIRFFRLVSINISSYITLEGSETDLENSRIIFVGTVLRAVFSALAQKQIDEISKYADDKLLEMAMEFTSVASFDQRILKVKGKGNTIVCESQLELKAGKLQKVSFAINKQKFKETLSKELAKPISPQAPQVIPPSPAPSSQSSGSSPSLSSENEELQQLRLQKESLEKGMAELEKHKTILQAQVHEKEAQRDNISKANEVLELDIKRANVNLRRQELEVNRYKALAERASDTEKVHLYQQHVNSAINALKEQFIDLLGGAAKPILDKIAEFQKYLWKDAVTESESRLESIRADLRDLKLEDKQRSPFLEKLAQIKTLIQQKNAPLALRSNELPQKIQATMPNYFLRFENEFEALMPENFKKFPIDAKRKIIACIFNISNPSDQLVQRELAIDPLYHEHFCSRVWNAIEVAQKKIDLKLLDSDEAATQFLDKIFLEMKKEFHDDPIDEFCASRFKAIAEEGGYEEHLLRANNSLKERRISTLTDDNIRSIFSTKQNEVRAQIPRTELSDDKIRASLQKAQQKAADSALVPLIFNGGEEVSTALMQIREQANPVRKEDITNLNYIRDLCNLREQLSDIHLLMTLAAEDYIKYADNSYSFFHVHSSTGIKRAVEDVDAFHHAFHSALQELDGSLGQKLLDNPEAKEIRDLAIESIDEKLNDFFMDRINGTRGGNYHLHSWRTYQSLVLAEWQEMKANPLHRINHRGDFSQFSGFTELEKKAKSERYWNRKEAVADHLKTTLKKADRNFDVDEKLERDAQAFRMRPKNSG